MSLILNPSFQVPRVGTVFNAAPDSSFTLARWLALSDADGRINVAQKAAPSRAELTWNSAGRAGLLQIIENEQYQDHIDQLQCVSFDVKCPVGAISDVTVDVLAWSGTKNKPTNDPIATWGSTPALAANWTLLASEVLPVNGATARVSTASFVIPNAANLALIIRANGSTGDKLELSRVSVDIDGVFKARPWQLETQLCDWFFQHYSQAALHDTEFAWGRTTSLRDVGIYMPLKYPIRGSLGNAADLNVIWDYCYGTTGGTLANSGWWCYGGGAIARRLASSPTQAQQVTLSCNHRNYIWLTGVIDNDMPSNTMFIMRNYHTPATITVDGELRP